MSFDQDPNEQAKISGADFAQMCDEMKQLKTANANLAAALELMWDSSCTNSASRPSKAAFLAARAALTKHKENTE